MLAFDLGGGAPALITTRERVDDRGPHSIKIMRHGRSGSVRVDGGPEVFGKAEGTPSGNDAFKC